MGRILMSKKNSTILYGVIASLVTNWLFFPKQHCKTDREIANQYLYLSSLFTVHAHSSYCHSYKKHFAR